MSYNFISASTKQGLERFKELGDMKLAVITRSGDGTLSECFCEPDGTIVINQIGYEDWEDAEENNAFFSLEFLDPSPIQSVMPTCGEIALIASDESNHHDWNDLRFRQVYQDGYGDGAKWMMKRMSGKEPNP